MSIEREILKRIANYGDFIPPHFIYEINELLAQPEQTEHTKTKKEPAIYFAKDEIGYIRPVFKNPKETQFWVDVLHGGGG